MKTIDMFVERALLASKRISLIVKSISSLSKDMIMIAQSLSKTNEYVMRHEAMLKNLMHTNSAIVESIKNGIEKNSIDVSLPTSKDKMDKPN